MPISLASASYSRLDLGHEGGHLVRADVEHREAALFHLADEVGVGVDLGQNVGQLGLHVGRRGLGHGHAAVRAAHQVEALLLEGGAVWDSFGWRFSIATAEATHLVAELHLHRGVGPAAAHLLAEQRRVRRPGAAERHVGGLDAGELVELLLREVVGRVGARTRQRGRAGRLLGRLDEVLQRLERAVGRDHQRVGRVVEPVDGGDLVGLVAHVLLQRLQHDVRQVGAHHGVAVARHAVELRPAGRAAGAGLVLDRQALAGELLEHRLLQACRDVGLAARAERDDVVDRLVGIVGEGQGVAAARVAAIRVLWTAWYLLVTKQSGQCPDRCRYSAIGGAATSATTPTRPLARTFGAADRRGASLRRSRTVASARTRGGPAPRPR